VAVRDHWQALHALRLVIATAGFLALAVGAVLTNRTQQPRR
jgi:hypothetical protein